MPATRYWNGSSADNNFQTAGNWSGGVAPVNGDTAVFNSGSISVTAGLNNAALNLAGLYVTNGYTGTLGVDQANPLIVACSGMVMLCPGSGGAVYINSGGTNPIVNLYSRPQTYSATIYFMGTITNALLKAGACKAYSGTITNLWAEAEDQATTYLSYENVGATVTNFFGNGGSCSQSGASAVTTNTDMMRDTFVVTRGTAPTQKIRGPAVVYYNTPDGGGTGPTVTVYPGGVFDASQDPVAKTVAAIIVHDGGHMYGQNPPGTITYTAAPKNPLGQVLSEAIG